MVPEKPSEPQPSAASKPERPAKSGNDDGDEDEAFFPPPPDDPGVKDAQAANEPRNRLRLF